MFKDNPRNISYLFSFAFHLLLILILMIVKFSVEPDEAEYVTVGFGSGMSAASPGPVGEDQITEKENLKEQKQLPQKEERKKVELPESKNKDADNIITEADKKKNKENVEADNTKPLNANNKKAKGTETAGEGDGGFGFEIDFGGNGMRKIYSYSLPSYPEGVSKEIDVKLSFSILPDGTVGKIFPLIKADARLEQVAINSLRQWRFEPLPPNAKQLEQTVVITFPYRLQ